MFVLTPAVDAGLLTMPQACFIQARRMYVSVHLCQSEPLLRVLFEAYNILLRRRKSQWEVSLNVMWSVLRGELVVWFLYVHSTFLPERVGEFSPKKNQLKDRVCSHVAWKPFMLRLKLFDAIKVFYRNILKWNKITSTCFSVSAFWRNPVDLGAPLSSVWWQQQWMLTGPLVGHLSVSTEVCRWEKWYVKVEF